MRVYTFADLTLESSVALPELRRVPPGCDETPDIEFFVADDTEEFRNTGDWCHATDPTTHQIVLSIATSTAGFVLSFPGLADFEISARGDRIEARPNPEVSRATIRHLLLDQVLPRVVAHRGRMVLHASAVAVGDSAVAFAGASGCGKSTLAASLDAAGFEALTDDALIVTVATDPCSVHAPYPGLRLWPSTLAAIGRDGDDLTPMAEYSTKCRLPPARCPAPMARPLAALFLLAPAPENSPILAERISARDTCMAVIRSTFHLDVANPDRAAQLLEEVTDLVNRVPVRTLAIPHDYSRLPEVHDVVLRLVAGCAATAGPAARSAVGAP